jgi:hypothetical protein
VSEGMPVISLVFFAAMMAQADLILIVEPRLIVLGPCRVGTTGRNVCARPRIAVSTSPVFGSS